MEYGPNVNIAKKDHIRMHICPLCLSHRIPLDHTPQVPSNLTCRFRLGNRATGTPVIVTSRIILRVLHPPTHQRDVSRYETQSELFLLRSAAHLFLSPKSRYYKKPRRFILWPDKDMQVPSLIPKLFWENSGR